MQIKDNLLPDNGSGEEILFLGDAVHALLLHRRSVIRSSLVFNERRMTAGARRANRRHDAGGEPSFARLCDPPKKKSPCPLPVKADKKHIRK